MMPQVKKRHLIARFLGISFLLFMVGCVSSKGQIREGTEESPALQLFKEGAELLYVDNQAALEKFDQASSKEPGFIPACYNAGVALEALHNLPEAKRRYELCLEHKKDQADCLLNLLLVKAKLGENDAALALAESYLTEYPETPSILSAVAQLAFLQKDYVRAEQLARAAIERDAENIEALFVMAHIFYEQKKYAATKWVAKNALELAPSHGGFHLLLGHVEESLDLLHDALDSYAEAVLYQPTEEALESYGLLLLKRGRAPEALTVLERLVKLSPDTYQYHLHLGNAFVANRKFDEAKAEYLRALELKPDEKDINFNLGLLFYDLKPKDMPELERLKTAESYFKAFLDQPQVNKDRQKEVKEYLEIIKQKIEFEEYKASSAQEVEAEPEPSEGEPEAAAPSPESAPQEEPVIKSTDQQDQSKKTEDSGEDLSDLDEKPEPTKNIPTTPEKGEEKALPEDKKKPKNKDKPEPKKPLDEDVFDEEDWFQE